MSYSDIFAAAQKGTIDDVISFAGEDGVDVNAVSSSGITLLHYAIGNVNSDIAEYLVSNGANVNTKAKGITPLHLAVGKEKLDAVKLLISNSADINAVNNDGATPLHWAVERGCVEIAKVLTSSKADIKAKNSAGQTPLDLAKKSGNTAMLQCFSGTDAPPRTEKPSPQASQGAPEQRSGQIDISDPATTPLLHIILIGGVAGLIFILLIIATVVLFIKFGSGNGSVQADNVASSLFLQFLGRNPA